MWIGDLWLLDPEASVDVRDAIFDGHVEMLQ